jgi:hypothetical protein
LSQRDFFFIYFDCGFAGAIYFATTAKGKKQANIDNISSWKPWGTNSGEEIFAIFYFVS